MTLNNTFLYGGYCHWIYFNIVDISVDTFSYMAGFHIGQLLLKFFPVVVVVETFPTPRLNYSNIVGLVYMLQVEMRDMCMW